MEIYFQGTVSKKTTVFVTTLDSNSHFQSYTYSDKVSIINFNILGRANKSVVSGLLTKSLSGISSSFFPSHSTCGMDRSLIFELL